MSRAWRTRSRVRWTILAAFCATLILNASACGGNSSRTEVLRLKSAPPSFTFVTIKGPAGAVKYIERWLRPGTFKEDAAGVFAPPPRYPRPRCSFTHTISATDAPDLQRWRGRKVTISIYDSAWPYCQTLELVFDPVPPG